MDKRKTFGEKRVRINFNNKFNSDVDKIKAETALLIDFLQSIRTNEVSKTSSDSLTKNLVTGEKLRLISLAQTAYEEAAMWAVKAITSE